MDKNSVIFGIGLGFVILGLVLYIGSSVVRRSSTVSDQEIVSRARELGMIMADEQAELTDDEIAARATVLGMVYADKVAVPSPVANDTVTEPVAEPTTGTLPEQTAEPVPQTEPPAQAAEPPAQTEESPAAGTPSAKTVVTIRIPTGATAANVAEILEADGVITDASEFAKVLEPAGAVKAGLYILPAGGDYDRILEILLDR